MAVEKTLIIMAFAFLSFTPFSFAQQITEENYLKVDSEIWEEYEKEMHKISELRKIYPEKKIV